MSFAKYALCAVLLTSVSTFAIAQNAPDKMDKNRPAAATMQNGGMNDAKMPPAKYYEETKADFRASKLIGTNIVNAQNETIGEVEDVIVGEDRKVRSVIVGVGGFLGIGETWVNVELASLQITSENNDDDLKIVMNTTKEQLKAAPKFEYESTWRNRDDRAANPAGTPGAAPGTAPSDRAAATNRPADGAMNKNAAGDNTATRDNMAANKGDMERKQGDMANKDKMPANKDNMAQNKGDMPDRKDDMAQNRNTPANAPGTQGSTADNTQQPDRARMGQAPAAGDAVTTKGYYTPTATDFRVSQLIGTNIVNAQNETIGEVEDLVLTKDNEVRAAIVGVGGFLGMGETWVNVDLSSLRITRDGTSLKVAMNTTKEQLEKAPRFKYESGWNDADDRNNQAPANRDNK